MSMQLHLDESGTHSEELTVAGYLFEDLRYPEFNEQWDKVITSFDLKYFHMVDCAHGAPPFDKLSKSERIRVQMLLMRLLKRYAVNGVVCNVRKNSADPKISYLRAVQGAIGLAERWATKTGYNESLSCVLEHGSSGQGIVEAWLTKRSESRLDNGQLVLSAYSFCQKEGNAGVQAADLLSWQYHNFTKKRLAGGLSRLDLRALLRHPHIFSDDCGDPPTNDALQSVKQSRSRLETNIYLPKASKDEVESTAGLVVAKDFVPFTGERIGLIFSCPECYRALAEGVEYYQITDLVVKCWCGCYCKFPSKMAPLS